MLAGKPLQMILTPELAGLAASVLGVLGLILRKARCFIRQVGSRGMAASASATLLLSVRVRKPPV